MCGVRPGEVYRDVFPAHADVEKLAYHFVADYPSGSKEHPEVIERLAECVGRWSSAWKAEDVPKLMVCELEGDDFVVFDSREIAGNETIAFIGREQARAMLLGSAASGPLDWAKERKYCLPIDGQLVPLAVAEPALITSFESESISRGPTGGLYPRYTGSGCENQLARM